MDRYVIRERRFGSGHPSSNQQISFLPPNAEKNNMVLEQENACYGIYNPDVLNAQRSTNTGVVSTQKPNKFKSTYCIFANLQLDVVMQNRSNHKSILLVLQNPGHIVSGIDPRYLASYSDTNASYIATGVNHHTDLNLGTEHSAYTDVYSDYQNKHFIGAERFNSRKFPNTRQPVAKEPPLQPVRKQLNSTYGITSLKSPIKEVYHNSFGTPSNGGVNLEQTKKTEGVIQVKNEAQISKNSRFDKLKALNKSGPRVFSGPVEKVLKWHKALQEVGVLILYEVVAKCVSVRPGKSSAKILVVRDENGPAMEVVYYEIDFLLPELKLPCTVRVIGRMLYGTCRLQAFHVRPATGDDVAILPRRTAVAQHHVTKLFKDYVNEQ